MFQDAGDGEWVVIAGQQYIAAVQNIGDGQFAHADVLNARDELAVMLGD
jgi:hypothetical protein